MNIETFVNKFNSEFPAEEINKAHFSHSHKIFSRFIDLCPKIEGMISIKKQRFLNLAYSCLEEQECYLEVGTFQGKSLVSAMINNPARKTYACDNFSEFTAKNSQDRLMENLKKYGLEKNVVFFNQDFVEIFEKNITDPIGMYFYDGAHDEQSQYLGIKKVEPLLSDNALVIVDDWRLADDSQSYAKAGTEKAIAESSNHWELLFELPARYNGDRGLWWNGVAVFSFQRTQS